MNTRIQVMPTHVFNEKVARPMEYSNWHALWQSFRHQRISAADLWVYGLTFIPAIILLMIVMLQPKVPVAVLMKDPLGVVQLTKECCHVYYGLVSNVGILAWTTGAAVSIFVALLLFINGHRGSEVTFLTVAGLFTGWLCHDDLFMVHEDVLPLFGVPQPATYAAYASFAALYFALAWRHILAARPVLMLLALALLLLATSEPSTLGSTRN